jgi:2-dehydropantoate 2-reductase
VDSPFGKFTAAVERTDQVPAADVLWIAVKATQLEEALTSLRNPGSVAAIVPLLNGVEHVSLLRSRYGQERVIPGTISVESERVRPGYIVHRSPFARMNVAASGRRVLESALNQLQQLGFVCQFVEDEQTLLWSKLVFLAPMALTTTAAAKTIGEIRSTATWASQLEACVREACAVATAEGARVDAEAMLSTIRNLPGPMRSSMQKDVEQGRLPELDAIGGPILRGAERHNFKVPVTRQLVEAVATKSQAAQR